MLTLFVIELGITVIVAVIVAADMAQNGHPSLGD